MSENHRVKQVLEPSAQLKTSATSTPVYLVITPGALLLDLAGVAEPLRLANRFATQQGDVALFDLRIVGVGDAMNSSLPVQLVGYSRLPEKISGITAQPSWVVLIGTMSAVSAPKSVIVAARKATLEWLRNVVAPAMDAREARVWTVCSGALLAAAAGLLDGRRCTTHHELIEQLRREHPKAIVEDDRIFVIDGPVATSAGITAGIDLALAAINERCGAAIASNVARDLVVYWRRAGGDPQLSPLIDHRNHLHPAVHRAQDAIVANPQQPWDAADIAAAAFVSQRHVRRLFVEHAGITPIAYVNRIRVALARQILQSESPSVEQVATRVGFGSARHLREAWHRESDGAPSDAKSRLARPRSSRSGQVKTPS
jgi:transcriptional regulator GlxA family with amidase domain